MIEPKWIAAACALVVSWALATGGQAEVSGLTPLPSHNILRLSPLPAPVNPEIPAVPGQFGSVAHSTGGGRATAPGLRLSASFGRVVSADAPDFLFGDIISPPLVDASGAPLAPQGAGQEGYWRAEPVRPGEQVKVGDALTFPLPTGANERYHFSRHAAAVYASQEGRISVVWRTRLPVDSVTNSFAVLEQTYTISSSSRLPRRQIFWTEGRFTGPTVGIPVGIVQDLEIVYNSSLPETVPEGEAVLPPAIAGAPVVDETFWFDQTQSVLRAINREGRVLVEFLGATRGAPGSGLRQHLGIEVVDVIQETLPVEVTTLLGEQLLPKPDGITTDPRERDLTPHQVDSLTLGASFTERHTRLGRNVYYAVRENASPLRVQFYWLERGPSDILWPVYLNCYRLAWPESIDGFPARFARPADPESSDKTFVALPRTNTPELVYQDDEENGEATLDFQSRFSVDLTGGDNSNRSLLRFSAGNDFWYLRTYSTTEATLGDADRDGVLDITATALVGERIPNPPGTGSVAGYIDATYGTSYNPGAYIDPFDDGGLEAAENGAIIPVNALPGKNRLRVWWFRRIDPPPGLGGIFEPVFVPSVVAGYTLSYPGNARQIVMASNEGSGDLTTHQREGAIYVQNDPGQHGYNPNEEHALMLAGRAYALRDDLNVAGVSSEPFVLVDYIDSDNRPSMAVFEVLRENDAHTFLYSATAGTLLQAPMPLPVLDLPLLANGQSRNEEAPSATADRPANDAALATHPHYARFTFEDRKGHKWIYRGPHEHPAVTHDNAPLLAMRYFYKTREGFAFPNPSTGADTAPAAGAIVPFLRPYANGVDRSAGFTGHPVTGTPIGVAYTPAWPAQVPELRYGETLTLPKFGLPQIRGQRSLQIVYESSINIKTAPPGETDSTPGPASVVLHDPTRAKSYALDIDTLDSLPASIATTGSRGLTFFQNLPTHLQQRVFFDPNRGTRGTLVFEGAFVDEAAGEDYLLPNVLSPHELAVVQGLCDAGDARKAAWDAAVAGLSTTVERFIEDPAVRGTYIADPREEVHSKFGATEAVALTSPPARPAVPDPKANLGFFDEAVDSCALTAVGGGSGFVVLIAGNGASFTPEEEPVSVHIVRVGGGLYTGELKPLVAANPLSENVTVQHTGDFAAQAEAYQFEWRKAPPTDGLSPAVYEFQHAPIATAGIEYIVARENEPTGEILTFPAVIAINDEAAEPGLGLAGPLDLTPAVPSGSELAAVYFGLALGSHDSVSVSINGIPAFDSAESPPATGLPSAVAALMGGPSPAGKIYAVDARLFRLDQAEPDSIELVYSSGADPGATSRLDLRLAVTTQVDRSAENYLLLDRLPGKNRHLVAGSGIDTLGDNYFIMRYRPLEGHALFPIGGYPDAQSGWSRWTRPALVEGWIKRVLAGINPFNQRISDFYDNAIDTEVSLVAQAGPRWEGNIALNLESAKNAGLIEIYETVLKRGISLSIDGTPEVDYAPANDALLLAAGYLADLYLVLGNEAFADAANPTILFDAQAVGTVTDASTSVDFESVFRNTATARFAFQGQVASLLEEELHLLRGRDDFLAPGIEISPVYNRLFWNYTRGIDAGEVFYALNYNITERDDDSADGKIDAADASRQFPQGHGDAYGHYLTALGYYYRLLTDHQFTWGTRSETVNILGQPVSVDYLDERKFTAAATSLARTARQIQSLEHRKSIQNAAAAGWSHLGPTRENPRTGRIRTWGFDDWSHRGGQGAYYHWVTANALLPEEDTGHEGIQKIDRTTVPELDALATAGAAIQHGMDSANLGLNPLDLTSDSLVFDISPQQLHQGETHFEQIYARAVKALQNAFSVFDRATESSRLLRALENQNQELDAAITDQEGAFVLQLLDIFGTPYPGDIGPGKTYPQGYAGPDIFRFMYIDRPFEIFSKDALFAYPAGGTRTFTLALKDTGLVESLKTPEDFARLLRYDGLFNQAETSRTVEFTVDRDTGPYQIAATSLGRRQRVGSLQDALADVRLAEEKLYAALASMDTDRSKFLDELKKFEADVTDRILIQRAKDNLDNAHKTFKEVISALKGLAEAFELTEKTSDQIAAAAKESLPLVVGTASDVTSAARGGILAAKISSTAPLAAAKLALKRTEAVGEAVFAVVEVATRYYVLQHENDTFFRAQAADLKSKYTTALAGLRNVDDLHVAHARALERYRTELAKGEAILRDREAYRRRAAAIVQGYRTRDVAFRSFRTEALEQYQTLFDWAAKYTFLAAQAYDYETGLLGSESGAAFLGGIVGSRALGLLDHNGMPIFAASQMGDPGLSGFLAKLEADWNVVEGRLGFNNPDAYGTTFSLRREYLRIPSGPAGDLQWREALARMVQPNLLADSHVAAHALQIDRAFGTPISGIVVPFPSTIATGLNFFGQPLAAGDHRFSESNFATKIHAAGVVLEGYKGMDPCLVCSVTGPGPDTSSHPDALSATPHVYLLPAGADTMSTPPLGPTLATRRWQVLDHALPLPFDVGGIAGTGGAPAPGSTSLDGSFLAARKHQAFRAVGKEEFFVSNRSDEYTNSRLVGRSVVNSRWKLVIPAAELLNDPEEGLRRFINSVTDIKIHFHTYSYSGN